MKHTLVETVEFCFPAQVIAQLSHLVEEQSPQVESALQEAIPLLVNRLLNLAERVGTPELLLHVATQAHQTNVLGHLASLENSPWHERSHDLLLDLFGETYQTTINQVAARAGIRPAAGDTLLQVAAAAVLGVLGKFAAENRLSPEEFLRWLQSQKDELGAAMLPPTAPPAPSANLQQAYAQRQPASTPPRIASMPMRQPAAPARSMAAPATPASAEAAGGRFGWQWGLLLLVAVSLGYFFGNGFGLGTDQPAAQAPAPEAAPATGQPATQRTRRAEAMPAFAGHYDPVTDTYIYDTGRPIVLKLADGTTQQVGSNSTENKLYTFLSDPTMQVDSVNRTKGWINFDRVNFETAKATLTPESAQQLRNVAAILKTFPNAVVKLGGYTDSTGIPLKNLQISEERAKTAMMTLATLGVAVDHLQSKGYGARHYVVSNTTPAGRSLNRRISIRVVKK